MEHGLSTSPLIAALVGMMLLAAALLLVANRVKWPFTVLLVIAGGLLHASGVDIWAGLDHFSQPEVATEIILVILLPTLIFEAAFNLDANRLRYNWLAIFTLAVPGTVITTLLIGTIVALLTPLSWEVAFLLGALLSATDPISVIALFKKLGAPKDLTLLMEGESLFNDATAIILTKLLLAALLTGIGMPDAVLSGLLSFVVIVVGGIVIGGVLGVAFSWIAGQVDDQPFVEITLTLVLAYGSYLLANVMGSSGILATVTAGLVMGSIGRPRLSTSAYRYLEHYWSYTAFAANSLIFLLVGLRADLGVIMETGPILVVVLLAMLLARAALIYGLTPLVGRVSRNSHPISYPFRHLLFWGGLRGAVTLALALSLEHTFVLGETVVALATGAVLFTILVQGLSMGRLVQRLKLDKPELSHQLMRMEGWLSAYHEAKLELEKIKQTQAAHSATLDDMLRSIDAAIVRLSSELKEQRVGKLDLETDWRLFLTRCFTIEITFLHQLSENGYLTESAFLRLRASILQQLDALRHDYPLPEHKYLMSRSKPNNLLMRFFLGREDFRSWYGKEEYLEAWGRAQSCKHLLNFLKEMEQNGEIVDVQIPRAKELYQSWMVISESRMNNLKRSYPEAIRSLGTQQLKSLTINIQRQAIKRQVRAGALTEGIADIMLQELSSELMHARRGDFSLLPSRITGLLSRTKHQRRTSRYF
ncbi:sodium:proton antiporter [Photobacterium sp. DA100]|uniref:cation:proton antiporter n=1 Tax=Photobacterium sp. DA100 TaxID=3027472 RepID=UPI00247A70BC|nr:sodium:proton antiporter [Photobacterium sp. DA100]WEM43443.1 sodium:proton antiporter [Photobacterium sp. DA100]